MMASTLDGKIGANQSESDSDRIEIGISSEADREFLESEISKADAIIVGASSIRANGQCLEALGKGGKYPHWYVYATKEISKDFAFWKQKEIPRTIVSSQGLPKYDPGVEFFCYNANPVSELCLHLESCGYSRVLLFGGGHLNRMFYEAGVVKKLRLAISPMILGHVGASDFVSPGLSGPVYFKLKSSRVTEDFIFLFYDLST